MGQSDGEKSTDDDSNNDDGESYICMLCFQRGVTKMMPVKCKLCKDLAHPDCADIKDEGFVVFAWHMTVIKIFIFSCLS